MCWRQFILCSENLVLEHNAFCKPLAERNFFATAPNILTLLDYIFLILQMSRKLCLMFLIPCCPRCTTCSSIVQLHITTVTTQIRQHLCFSHCTVSAVKWCEFTKKEDSKTQAQRYSTSGLGKLFYPSPNLMGFRKTNKQKTINKQWTGLGLVTELSLLKSITFFRIY